MKCSILPILAFLLCRIPLAVAASAISCTQEGQYASASQLGVVSRCASGVWQTVDLGSFELEGSSLVPISTDTLPSATSDPASSTGFTTVDSSPTTQVRYIQDTKTIYTGQLTWYYPDHAYGSCGEKNSSSDMVAALAADMMDKTTMCNAKILITVGPKSSIATIVDTCPACAGASLDLSGAVFQIFADEKVGVITDAQWHFVDDVMSISSVQSS